MADGVDIGDSQCFDNRIVVFCIQSLKIKNNFVETKKPLKTACFLIFLDWLRLMVTLTDRYYFFYYIIAFGLVVL